MNETRFDGWTRRRFGLAAGGLTAGLLGLAGVADADARNKRKRKRKKQRCLPLGADCAPGGKQKCCGALRCEQRPMVEEGEFFCCKGEDQTCRSDSECCPGFSCDRTVCLELT